MELGYNKDEICNRDGCKGIIDEHDKDGGCSCHLNPPCSYCTTSTAFCPVCEWDAQEEEAEIEANEEPIDNTWYENLMKRSDEHREKIYAQMRGEIPVEKLDYLSMAHSNSSMKKEGVYPDGMTLEEVRKEVRGTFGGRFERFGDNAFSFIAYTD